MYPDPEKLHGKVVLIVDGEEIVIEGKDFEFVDGGERDRDGDLFPCIHKGYAKTESGEDVAVIVWAYENGDVSEAKISDDETHPDLNVEIDEDSLEVVMVRDPRDHDD